MNKKLLHNERTTISTRPIPKNTRRLHIGLVASLLLLLSFTSNVVNATVYTIGTGTTSTTASGVTPFSTLYEDSRVQYLYLASELTGAGATGGLVNSVAFNITSLNVMIPTNVNIKIGTTTAAVITAITPGLTVHYSAATVTPVLGWNTYTLSTPFLWNGTDNIIIEVCMDNSTYDDNYGVQTFQFPAGDTRSFGYYDDGTAGCSMTTGSSPSAANRRRRPNCRFDIIPAITCGGQPSSGTAAGPTGICANVPFSITTTGATSGLGLTYEWQSSPAGMNTYSTIVGATGTTLSVPSGQSAATDYKMIVTCTNGGLSATTNVVAVAMNGPTACYCTPTYVYGCVDDDDLNSFIIAGENGTSFNQLNTGCSPGAYISYTALPAIQFAQGLTYTGSINSTYTALYENAHIWIDFGDDGFFDPADTVGAVGPFSTTLVPFTITIPPGATLGNHRMRVRVVYDEIANTILPCSSYDYGETHDYMVSIIVPPTCPSPSALTATNVTAGDATLGWINSSSAPTFRIEYGPQGFTPGTGSFITASSNSYTLNGLASATNYSFYVRAICSSTDSSAQSGPVNFTTMVANDIPSGALVLSVNAGCTGNPYTNAGATQSTNEPFAGCRQTNGFHSVWFKFTAPASGFVRVTNDYTGATIGNTRIGIFFATDSSDFASFTMLACDVNNAVAVTGKSLVYVNGLIPGATYYIDVDGLNGSQAMGTFCVTVDEVTNAMLSAGGACAAGHPHTNLNTGYSGWMSLVDNTGKLIANVRQTVPTASPTNYTVSVNTNTASVRQVIGQYYLDRNYLIGSTGATGTPSYDVQFFFLAAEQGMLQTADANATLSNLNVTRQSGTACIADYIVTGGTNTALMQTSSGIQNGVDWVQVVTPGFSNFYIMSGASPLEIPITDIKAINAGARNRVDWITPSEHEGDRFEVERSADGKSFTRLASIAANGKPSSYSYWDESPVAGINYYRLRIIETDGQVSYTRMVTATVKGTGSFTVEAYPNPVSDNLTIVVSGSAGGNATVHICDVTGKTIKSAPVNNNRADIDMSNFAAGMYVVKYSDNEHSQTIKVNKK